jgi:hypothetical protein
MVHLREMFLYSLRCYFAPITGAYKGIVTQYRRLDRERKIWS